MKKRTSGRLHHYISEVIFRKGKRQNFFEAYGLAVTLEIRHDDAADTKFADGLTAHAARCAGARRIRQMAMASNSRSPSETALKMAVRSAQFVTG